MIPIDRRSVAGWVRSPRAPRPGCAAKPPETNRLAGRRNHPSSPSHASTTALTGTGNAELFGYYPSELGTNRVAQISKASGSDVATCDLAAVCSGLLCSIRARAFAHWGGQFYVFITTTDGLTMTDTAKVIRLDPGTGTNQVIPGLEDTGTIVVGAGVSTCAPVYAP